MTNETSVRVVPVVVRTAPERIWLQVSDDRDHFNEPFPGEEVTWCADSILQCEVEYVRSDLAAPTSCATGWAVFGPDGDMFTCSTDVEDEAWRIAEWLSCCSNAELRAAGCTCAEVVITRKEKA